MIDLDVFHDAFETSQFELDPEKRRVVDESADVAMQVIAGPGTGKTTALVARILKLIFVDGLKPGSIVATTFTKKAANELRSKVLETGYPLQECLVANRELGSATKTAIGDVDINQVWTGTTDSLCQELLTLYRPAGTQPPALIEEYVASTLMLHNGLFDSGRFNSNSLKDLLTEVTGETGWYAGRMQGILSTISDRLVHDMVDLEACLQEGPDSLERGRMRLRQALESYQAELDRRGVVDYARLERTTLEWLRAGHLAEFVAELEAVLVDEYQDSNLLQEQIYVELARGTDGAITIVGDDDQSLYRFRGATVELFTDFPRRMEDQTDWDVRRRNLVTNYRSTKSILGFVQRYVEVDSSYQGARAGDKPGLRPGPDADEGVPILGMFRDELDGLAADLASFLRSIFRDEGFQLPGGGLIRAHPEGDVGDAALLSYSPNEGINRQFLPGKLRDELETYDAQHIPVFNPRGQNLQKAPEVGLLMGLFLLCIDPQGVLQAASFTPGSSGSRLDQWRVDARDLLHGDPNLAEYVDAWQTRGESRNWPSEVPALDLVYALAHFVPGVLQDPEGQLYLEAVTRQLSAAEQVSAYGGRILTNPDAERRGDRTDPEWSVKHLMQNVAVPIASGVVDVNEELIEDFPRDRLSVLSVHQSKGLEFPLVIVDVGSRFKNPGTYAKFRFPEEGQEEHRMEDYFRPFSELGPPERSPRDRAFDDLIRRYFVAFSRARNVLLLVGLEGSRPGGSIKNVATGWDRNEETEWTARDVMLEI